MLLLLKTPEGFALFKVLEEDKLSAVEDLAKEFESARQTVRPEAFLKFVSTAEALEPPTRLIKSQRHKGLWLFLRAHCGGDTLGVADSELCQAIKDSTKIECVHNRATEELMRGVQSQLTGLISGLADQVDTMIIQAIGMLDDREKELNAHAESIRGWYGCHFPELDKIVQDNVCYARTVKLMGSRSNAAKLDFSEMLPKESEAELKKAAAVSTGKEISDLDIINVREICDQVLSLSEYRSQLRAKLKSRMDAAAPNLTALVGELVGARLIAHAGSMMNLAKKPGSKIQILGTGKHALIYDAPLLSQVPQEMRWKISRALAAKTALAARIDVSRKDQNTSSGVDNLPKTDNSFGVGNLAKIEAMLRNVKGRGHDDESSKSKPVTGVYVGDVRTKHGAIIKTFKFNRCLTKKKKFNCSADSASEPASTDGANADKHVTQAAKEERGKRNGKEKEKEKKKKKEKVEVTLAPVHGNVSADGKAAGAGEKKKKKHAEETEQPGKKEREKKKKKKKRVSEHVAEATEQSERKKKKKKKKRVSENDAEETEQPERKKKRVAEHVAEETEQPERKKKKKKKREPWQC